jgi:hypothetical protein
MFVHHIASHRIAFTVKILVRMLVSRLTPTSNDYSEVPVTRITFKKIFFYM